MQPYKILLGALGVGILALALAKGPMERYDQRMRERDRQARAEIDMRRAEEREAEKLAQWRRLAEYEECAMTYMGYFDDYAEGVRKANSRIKKTSDLKPGMRIRIPRLFYPTGHTDPARITVVESIEEVDMYVDGMARFAAGEEKGDSCVASGIRYFAPTRPSVFPAEEVKQGKISTESAIR